MPDEELGPFGVGEPGEALEVLLAGGAWGEQHEHRSRFARLVAEGVQPSDRDVEVAPDRASIHFSPSKTLTVPDRAKNASDIALWKWVLGPPLFAPISTRYSPNSPLVEAAVDR